MKIILWNLGSLGQEKFTNRESQGLYKIKKKTKIWTCTMKWFHWNLYNKILHIPDLLTFNRLVDKTHLVDEFWDHEKLKKSEDALYLIVIYDCSPIRISWMFFLLTFLVKFNFQTINLTSISDVNRSLGHKNQLMISFSHVIQYLTPSDN